MHYGQMLQSHALHFFHLSSPDLLFGFDSDPCAARNIVGVIAEAPDIAKPGRAAAQVRPGGDPPHRRQARARHRLDAGRHEPAREPRRRDDCSSATSADARLGRGCGGDRKAAPPTALYDAFGTFAPRCSRWWPDGALGFYTACCARATPSGAILVDGAADQGYRAPDRRRDQTLDLHEVPAPARARPRPAGTASARWRACRTATSSHAAAGPRAASSSPGAAARRCTRRWPTTGRA